MLPNHGARALVCLGRGTEHPGITFCSAELGLYNALVTSAKHTGQPMRELLAQVPVKQTILRQGIQYFLYSLAKTLLGNAAGGLDAMRDAKVLWTFLLGIF
jgi:hypothetical protein